jgi:alkanesulfonate monooxygenase SsuD/methylene tetrahydromethanopterin reductase-like flavin-dependent oxidoreductase (luciferase family)
MKFGIFDHIDANGQDIGDELAGRLRLVELYEGLGFYCYHLAEHHATELGMAPSPSVFLAAVAARTRTIRFGSLVYLLPLHHPVRLLEEIAVLDRLSGGRFQLGVGRGGQPAEHTRFGLAVDDLAPMFEEALGLILEGLKTGRIAAHNGAHYKLPEVELRVRPAQQPFPPLWYGTASSHRNAWAADHGVNLLCLIPDARTRPIFDDYREQLDARGKLGEGQPFMGLARQLVVAPTDSEALALGERAWKRFADSFNWLPLRLGMPPFPLAPTFTAAMEAGMAFAGAPASVRDWIVRSRDVAGIDYMALEIGFGDLAEPEIAQTAELFAREVMPAFG